VTPCANSGAARHDVRLQPFSSACWPGASKVTFSMTLDHDRPCVGGLPFSWPNPAAHPHKYGISIKGTKCIHQAFVDGCKQVAIFGAHLLGEISAQKLLVVSMLPTFFETTFPVAESDCRYPLRLLWRSSTWLAAGW